MKGHPMSTSPSPAAMQAAASIEELAFDRDRQYAVAVIIDAEYRPLIDAARAALRAAQEELFGLGVEAGRCGDFHKQYRDDQLKRRDAIYAMIDKVLGGQG